MSATNAKREAPKPPSSPGYVPVAEHNARVAAAKVAKRGFSDQDVIRHVLAGHSLRETATWFAMSHQRVSQILRMHGYRRGKGGWSRPTGAD